MSDASNIPALGELVVEVLARGHGARFRAAGDSMHPTIRDGDVIEVEPLLPDRSVTLGEILLVDAPRGLLVHRFVATLSDGRIVTRGDNSDGDDEPVVRSRVLGRITRRERRGRLAGMTGTASLVRQRMVLRLRRLVRRLRGLL